MSDITSGPLAGPDMEDAYQRWLDEQEAKVCGKCMKEAGEAISDSTIIGEPCSMHWSQFDCNEAELREQIAKEIEVLNMYRDSVYDNVDDEREIIRDRCAEIARGKK